MQQGWILSEGTVVAAAVASPRRSCGARMAKLAADEQIAVMGCPWCLLLGPGAHRSVEVVTCDHAGTILRRRSLAGRVPALVLPSRGVVVAPGHLLEASGIGVGSVIEFRAAS